MKKYFTILSLVLVSALFGSDMVLQKKSSVNLPKNHPYTQQFNKSIEISDAKTRNYSKLLVILVDFTEETVDDPMTTGNGKFLLESDPNYKTTIGSPPHNIQYFEKNLEALRYYYLAASNESYNLQYDVYPKDKPAYTLPHSMAYYNPAELNSDVFLQRMEEYFKTSFETADQDDPEINFSDYGHFMIIHAGSDWQHDIFGDTPSDIPSFFIKVGSGKEAVVDGGYLISHACNVPSTISQDFSTSVEGNDTYYGGYGALNAVIAHEFGHSLGLVDLYNVYNFQPMVGVFDIMDSGGGGVLLDRAQDGGYVMVEGALPVLPGAFSRALLFSDYFTQNGLMKTVDQVNLSDDVILCASSKKQALTGVKPTILKVPLNNEEYLLIENRSVDPDSDGATAVHGDLDDRVILYPTAIEGSDNVPTYEYDYLLPSFISSNGASIGGGILVWHVNNDVLFNQGIIDNDGTFYSNFENNSVNTRISSRAVKVVEADGLPDIGNTSSYYWAGTAYEYFHKHKAILDTNGNFVNWALEIWRDRLNALSFPPLLDDQGNPSFYGLQINGDPQALMSIRLTTTMFDHSQVIETNTTGAIAAPIINSSFTNSPELPVITGQDISLYSHGIHANQPDFTNLFGSQDIVLAEKKFPLVTSNVTNNNIKELVWCTDTEVKILEYALDSLQERNISIPDTVRTTPLSLGSNLWIASTNNIYRVSENQVDSFTIPGIKCLASDNNELIALAVNRLTIYNTTDLQVLSQFDFPEACGNYEPIIYLDSSGTVDRMIFVMSNAGNIYKLQGSGITKIFTNQYQSLPCQMGLSTSGSDTVKAINSPAVFFGIDHTVYAIQHDGSLLPGFPKRLDNLEINAARTPRSLMIGGDTVFLYPYGSGSFVAVKSDAKLSSELSFNNFANDEGYFWWDSISLNLYWIHSGLNGKVLIEGSRGFTTNPLIWNGFRNAANGTFSTDYSPLQITSTSFKAYLVPNPVRANICRVHVENASGAIDLKIFDISGQLVLQQSYPSNDLPYRDLEINASKLSSGMYVVTLKCGKNTKILKFAVEK